MTKSQPPPDLAEIRRRFPLLVESLAHLPDRESHLRRIWEIEQRWNAFRENPDKYDEVVRSGQTGGSGSDGDYDVIYAGGTLGLLHAAVMACRFGRKVLVFDAHQVGRTHRDWNISDEELREFIEAGLFTPDEIEKAVANRYRTGFVKFHDANSKVKTPPLFMDNVLDVAIEADKLLDLAAKKLQEAGSEIISNLRFNSANISADRVSVECEDTQTGKPKTFTARLFVDATGTNSAVSRQINGGRSITHVCPTVGTVATGFAKGTEPGEVDFSVGEILVSTEDSSDDRQLIWEGFAGSPRKDEYTTYLFFYDSVDSKADKSIMRLFEDYFEKLPGYKSRTSSWKIVKPVYGYIPSIHHCGWKNVKKTAADRVLLVGDAAGLSSPLTFCGFGSHVRNLRRLTSMTEEALAADALDEVSLSGINAYEPRVAQMSSLAEFMRPMPKSRPSEVNETMNAVMMALSRLDKEIRRELFQDRVSFASFRKVLLKTAALHPKVFRLMLEHLGLKGSYWWIANIAEAAISEKKP